MIRPAVETDIDAIVAMGERFHAEAHWNELCPYVADDCRRSVEHLVGSDDGLIIVAEQGGQIIGSIGAMLAPIYFNFACRSAQEVFWFVDWQCRGVGGELLDDMEQRARQAGCKLMSMICLESLRPEAVGAFLRRRGYRATEHAFVKAL